ncbi:MAG: protoheme IX farnesyltransferase, partial [Sphingobacteriia bacterium]|nr:protoheme IX farnesyltransferase [Candidatus Fonsibacter lacus]
ALTPFVFNFTGWISAAVVSCMGLVFIIQAYKLYKGSSIEDARKLMFGSFIYLPLVQIALMLGHKFLI